MLHFGAAVLALQSNDEHHLRRWGASRSTGTHATKWLSACSSPVRRDGSSEERGRSTAVFETSPGKASADNPDSLLILLDPFSVEDGGDVLTRSGATVRSELFHWPP